MHLGDERVLSAAHQQIRQGFRSNIPLEPSDPSTASAIQHAEEVAVFLRQNVVQGKKEDGDLYSTFHF
jgi:complex III assembly factor LYRM7